MQRAAMNFLTLLGVIFIIFKITGIIDWSIIWVISPFWMPIPLGIGFMIIATLVSSIRRD